MKTTKRIFIGIDISDEARNLAAAYIRTLRGSFRDVHVGWERPEKLHLTLNFLGETAPNAIESVREIVARAAAANARFKLQIRETGVFPNAKRPRVLWLGVGGDLDEIRRIKSGLDSGLVEIGFESERRRFSPHLTIARLREPERSGSLAAQHLANDFGSPEFSVASLIVYESRLDQHGSEYSVLDRFDLKS